MVEDFVPTIAFVGGENCRSSAVIVTLPKRCTEICVGNETLDLVGRWVSGGFWRVDTVETKISAAVDLPTEIGDRIGRLAILFTREGEIYSNLNWLNSGEFGHIMPSGKRRLLRWISDLPSKLCVEQPDLFASCKERISLN